MLLAPAVDRVIATMRRMPRGDQLAFENRVPAHLRVAIERSDLDEILGTLLDNARSFASASVAIDAGPHAGQTRISIEDDGPGIPPEQRDLVLQRGFRLDEARPGTGLGLAIVADVAEAYSIGVSLDRSDLGGLAVRLTMPEKTN